MIDGVNGSVAGEVLDALVVADDLTGAADTAVAFAAAGLPTQVAFAGTSTHRVTAVLALDTDSRRHTPDRAADAVTAALRGAPAARLRMKKIDSTLRGNLGAETGAACDALGCGLAICAPAFPRAGRHTRAGVQWAMGERVGEVGDCFPGFQVATLGLEAVRAGRCAEELLELADRAQLVVVDAETDDDLVEVVRAGAALPQDVLWVGAGGLGAALAAVTSAPSSVGGPPPPLPGPVLAVVGSATPVAAAQAEALVADGAAEIAVPVEALLEGGAAGWADRVAAALADGVDVVVTIAHGERIQPGHGRRVVEALGTTLAPVVVRARPAAVLATGGETALTLARAVGASGLDVHAELEPGVVRSALTGGPGTTIVTKAGAFGDPGTLVRALGILRTGTPYEQERL